MNKAVFCIAKNLRQAEQIVDQLRNAGFPTEDISLLFSASGESGTANNMNTSKGTRLATSKSTKASEGAAAGGTVGGIIGGTLGLLVGIGTLAIPGMGPFIAAGPIMAALAGSAVGGSIGLLTGSLVGLGIPEYEAVHYAEKLKNQNYALISVHTNSSEDVERVKEIFERNGAEDISATRELAAPRRNNR